MKLRSFRFLLPAMLMLLAGCAVSAAAKKQATYHYQMGLSYLGENNLPGALVEFTEAEKIDPDNPELMNYLGLAYFRKSKYELSEKKYLRSIALKPDYSEARNNLAVTYLEMKRWDDAIHQLKLVIDDIFYQNQTNAGINLSLAYYGKGNFKEALAILRPLAAANPTDPRLRYHIGKVYYASDKIDLAVTEFRKALDLYPDYILAHFNLAQASMKLGDRKTAARHYKEVVRIAPDSEMAHLSREYLDLLK